MEPKENKPRSKRGVWIMFGVVVVAILSVGVWRLLAWRDLEQQFRTQVQMVIPANLDQDDQDELILVYENPANEDRCLLQAVDLQTRKPIWSSYTPKVYGLDLEAKMVDSGSGKFVIGRRRVDIEHGFDKISLSIHDLKTGKQQHMPRLPDGRQWGLYFKLWICGDLVLAGTRENRRGGDRITAIDLNTGKRVWETGVGEFLTVPVLLKDRVVSSSSGFNWVLDLRSGKLVNQQEAAGPGWLVGERYFTARWLPRNDNRYTLHELTLPEATLRPVLKDGQPVLLPENANPYDAVGIYRNRVISALGGHIKGRLESVPFEGTEGAWIHDFSDGFGHRGIFHEWKKSEPEVSSFHVIRDRYMPIILRKISDQEEERRAQKLVVFDLEEGKPAWQSEVFEQDSVGFISSKILYGPGVYFLLFPYPGRRVEQRAVLILDASTGRFRDALAVRISRDKFTYQGYPFTRFQPWMLSRGILYGFAGGSAWAIHPEDGRIEWYGPDKVEKVSVLAEVEKVLGTLPR